MTGHPKTLYLVAALLALVLSGCGGDAQSDSSSIVLPGEEGRPDVTVPTGPPPKELVAEDIKEGSGPPAKSGDVISVRYLRFGYKSHELLEDHWGKESIPFTLGAGQMNESWEIGLRGIKAGARRQLIVPAKLTSFGIPDVYVIDALSVKAPVVREEAKPNASLQTVEGKGAKPTIEPPPGPPPEKLVVRQLKEGSGRGAVPGDRLGLRYVDVNLATKVAQDRWSSNPPYTFWLGEGRVQKGWEIGLRGIKLGARRELIIPSRLAYGTGAMIYVIELLELERPDPKPRS